MNNALTTKIRMYRLHELGDCFLLSFNDTTSESHVLIDCGSFRNSNASSKKFKEITRDIRKIVGPKGIDLIVATHQHNDHMSGFQHARKDFESIGVEQVFLSWLDDENDALALDIGEQHNKVTRRLQSIRGRLKSDRRKELAPIRMALDEVVDERSFEIDHSFTGKATQFLKEVGTRPVQYLRPGQIVKVPNMSEDLVRIHVLGPPRNYKDIRSTNPRKGESYDRHLSSILFSIDELNNALSDQRADPNFPFNDKFKEKLSNKKNWSKDTLAQWKDYNKESWRNIDLDWLSIAKRFALHLNSYTNNTSLVLAFELVKLKKVLLFVGDAQAGNWRSWDAIDWKGDHPLDMDTLLRNTVFYKVGHHGSHNATSKKALDRMTHEDLVAFIPVNKKDPNLTKKNPWRMPAKNLYKALDKKTKGRIARMDEGKVQRKKNNWKARSLKVDPLFVEYTIKD
ncbi:MBL fold metallo-hydrolase [Flavobacteriaceae bacterium TP-CH-4]|uniref:MBL fold metallo-hydrolase n=1 Tax=Pelagihabitans pacificus TaxID=2696054 RepID=A0A967APP2_9FLAO|nr:MBL fold metallo-hydrolase [Pelagihabitans pacificus]NHF58043.1 MBL fold metallo-hydrolase [Pelagihabitans pacificus]